MRPQQVSIVLNQEFESVLHGHHTPVMLWGAPGIGKSQIISQIWRLPAAKITQPSGTT
jgi:replication-associated recombination protein RarA